ncbi:uncharacterized protein KY384_000094 [Bacidia gigantensis]|uniref:uncharacterized protein n=1 Tax=Bacidia gigantensis TaxID=2732470 RepID=UPI001D0590D4|nr:uncharacterized protein KY384_000094 [Bacidia gigantensis]KAG8526101.1 hypothetical protein KY384_000094 [Bacidia gigantensis]
MAVCPAPRLQTGQNNASILITGGALIDGTGAKRRQEDIRIVAGKIAAIGKLKPEPGERVIHAKGLIVAPGFIDAHSHADGGLLEDPDAETQIRQGRQFALSLQTWFDAVTAKGVALNIASFVGHGTMREQAMGADFRKPATPEQIARMRTLVAQEMESGALGLSSGLEYVPGRYSNTEELIACAQVAGKYDGIYISHVRNEDNQALDSFRELIRIADEGHLPAQISHIKLGSASVWGQSKTVLQMMADARKRGLDVTADVYPYLYWQSTIVVLIATEEWDNRALWTKGLADVGGADHVLLSSYTPKPEWAGRTIAQIAAQTQQDPVTIIQEIVRNTHGPEAKGKEGVIVTAMAEPDLETFIASPFIMFCSDGGLRGTHPRGAGSFPRVLSRYVRERKTLTLEAAIHKMTGLTAQRMGLTDRGVLAPGKAADIVLFDAARIQDTATTAHPTAAPLGIPTVFVNGVPALENGQITGARPGMILKRRGLGHENRSGRE